MRLPSAPSHVDHAAHDERLLDILEHDLLPQHPEFLDWAIVVMFYAYRKKDPLGSLQQLALYRVQLETIKVACM